MWVHVCNVFTIQPMANEQRLYTWSVNGFCNLMSSIMCNGAQAKYWNCIAISQQIAPWDVYAK